MLKLKKRWRTGAVAVGLSVLFAAPASADPLRALEIHRHLQGDWAEQDASSTRAEQACAQERRRLSLDPTGHVLEIQYLHADMTIDRTETMQIEAMPAENDPAPRLEFFGPEVDRAVDPDGWQDKTTITMPDTDHIRVYSGHAPRPPFIDLDRSSFANAVPHEAGVTWVRCASAPNP